MIRIAPLTWTAATRLTSDNPQIQASRINYRARTGSTELAEVIEHLSTAQLTIEDPPSFGEFTIEAQRKSAIRVAESPFPPTPYEKTPKSEDFSVDHANSVK